MDNEEWLSPNPYDYPWFLHMDKGRMSEHKPVQLSLISSYGQGRMTETKPIWLPLMSTYGQESNGKGRMAEPNTCNYPRFPHMDKEE